MFATMVSCFNLTIGSIVNKLGGQVSINLECTNCWMNLDFALTEFEFLFSFGDVKSIRIEAGGKGAANIDLLLALQMQLQTLEKKKLYSKALLQHEFSL